MTDDLIAIIACCILGMMAHGASRQTWMEWVLRVTYVLFIIGEGITLLADPNSYLENPFNYSILLLTVSLSSLLLFRPGREFISYLLTFFNQLMGITGAEYRGAQVSALKNFGSTIDELAKIFDVQELSTIIVNFINSIHYDPSLKLINIEKVAMIGKLFSSNLFRQEGMQESTLHFFLFLFFLVQN